MELPVNAKRKREENVSQRLRCVSKTFAYPPRFAGKLYNWGFLGNVESEAFLV